MRYEKDMRGMAEFLRSQQLQDLLRKRATLGAAWARAHTREDTGEHKKSIRVVDAGLTGGRVTVRVIADAPHSVVVEFGTRKRPGDHALRDSVPIIEEGGP
ncbi:hypothetical protein GCM10012275_52770 [Longimycelium tulufanense]|uniref:Uncharacterized protein n=1 Tax=Longimycelium tulufanense TaxID=907463 RepID=A0A8J3FWZ4_9PSEU|nr:HK97 gp10 family phage protein [Longimycelium tulufanense]GGM75531.1 hypothetical protein GCM10012275_52770 [Longimycelium tulufanense]